jgi:uncharacterized phiE125 gp8 family phage protein
MRTILTPAVLPDTALAELKSWLGISSTADDATLVDLLRAALEVCEGFTGSMPLEQACEELLPARTGCWQTLGTRPVQAVTLVEGIPADGARFTLAADAYAIDLAVDGGARVRLIRQGAAGRIAVHFTAGLAADWDSLPDALRHGAIRLAAFAWRQRDDETGDALPPAVVAALWRPWRRYRL